MVSACVGWCTWSDDMVRLLGEGGVLVFDHVLGDTTAFDTFHTVLKLAQNGELRNAGVGRSGKHRQDETIRQDLITWVDDSNAEGFQCVTALFQDVQNTANQC